MSAPCRRVGCQWREERTGRNVAFLSEMNYRCVFDSWCWLCGKYRLCQVNFEKASIFGQRQSAWPFRNNPSFHSFTSCFALFFFCFPFYFLFLSTVFLSFHPSFTPCFLSCACSAEPTCTSLTAPSANGDRHCLSTPPTDEAAFLFRLEYLYKFIGGHLY